MARLRIRIELSRGGVGVPLPKLASVVDEAQKFLRMLAEDVHIEQSRGEWLGFDFDNESLNFTAEFVGPVDAEQVRAFYAAFDGTTGLRRATIGQFARITEAIGEDELVGFGLYPSGDGAEPSEWRCLSRRDALRIAQEIDLLVQASGEQESHLPAVSGAAARLFGRTREEDAGLAERLARVEQRVEQHATEIHDMRAQSAAAETSFRNLLSAVENFCDQATHQIERIAPAALPAASPVSLKHPMSIPRWAGVGVLVALGAAALIAGVRMWIARPLDAPPKVLAAAPAQPTPQPTSQSTPRPAPPPAPEPRPPAMRIELTASEPSWVSMSDADGNRLINGLLLPESPRSFDVDRAAKLRTGNAGGLKVMLNGKPLGPLGPRGKIREIEFSKGAFKVTAPD